MSAVRRSSRLAATPTSTIPLTPKTSILRSGGVKRRLNIENEETPTKVKAAKVDSSDQQSPLQTTPKKSTKQAYFSPVKFEDSSDIASTTPPRSLFPSCTPQSTGFSTPSRNFSGVDSTNSGFQTPKSVRRKLFDEDETTRKCDLLPSTFSSLKTPQTQSGLGTVQRIAEQGKYARLISPVKDAANYPVPKKYESLMDGFKWMECVVDINKRRQKRSVFDEVSKDVQRKTKKNFTKDLLGQLLNVYPSSYNIRLEEHRTFGMKTPGKKHDLVIEPNLKKDLETYWRPPSPQKSNPAETQYGSPVKLTSHLNSPRKTSDYVPLSPRKSPTKATPQLRPLQLTHFDRLEPWRIACRKAIFKYKLLKPVFDLHEEFLGKIGASKNDLEIGAFHEKFNLESAPDVVPSSLPQPRKDSFIQAKIDPFLEKEDKEEEFVLPKAAEATLLQFKSPVKQTHTPNGKVPLSSRKFASGDTPKLSLYERIMLKQKAKEAKNEPIKVAKELRKSQLEFIRDNLLYSIWSYFSKIKPTTTSKLELVKYRIGKDTTLDGGQLDEHLQVLCEVAVNYFDILTAGIHGTKYLRLLTEDQNEYQNCKKLIEEELKKYD